MKILIVGGGIGGLALAGFLKDKAEITLVDKAPKWGDIGYAIALWGNGQKILDKLGVLHDIKKGGYEIPWDAEGTNKGKILKVLDFGVFSKYGPTLVVTRTLLHMTLVKKVENGVDIRLNTTVEKIAQDGDEVNVTFSNGSKDTFDLVVGADGIHSKVRDLVFGGRYLKPYGFAVWTFWSPKGLAFPRGVFELSDAGSIYFIYPMEDRAVVMLATANDKGKADIPPTKELLHELFADFEESIGHMIDAIEDPAHIFRDKLMYVDMKDWYQGQVVLLGDAQHASSPLTGMGASMALEDAFVLAEELNAVDTFDISSALQKYKMRRARRIKNFHKMSKLIESWIMVKSPILSKMRDFVISAIPTSYFVRKIKKVLDEKI